MINNNKELIKVIYIVATTYEDGSSWLEYQLPGGARGYMLTEDFEDGQEEAAEKYINSDTELYNSLMQKKNINMCSKDLKGLIIDCLYSEDMYFLEAEDVKGTEKEKIQYAENIIEEAEKLGLGEYITHGEDDEVLIMVYGGVITQFLFN